MFIREKKSGDRSYLQVVENRRENGKTKQRVIATLGRLDVLQKTGALDALLCSGGKFSQTLLLLSAYRRGEVAKVATRRIGPALVFERLWKDTGCDDVIKTLLGGKGGQTLTLDTSMRRPLPVKFTIEPASTCRRITKVTLARRNRRSRDQQSTV